MDGLTEFHSDSTSSDDSRRQTLRKFKKLKQLQYVNSVPEKIPMMTSKYRGPMWVDELLQGHPIRMYNCFGMHTQPFLQLCSLISDRGLWEYRQQQCVDLKESLAIFLHCVRYNKKHTDLVERFQHSTETSDRHVKIMARTLCILAKEIIRPLSEDVHDKILYNPERYPYFKDCIGAIDGTCISASASRKIKENYRTRKHTISQNVMAAVDHEMRFVFLHAGWEGSAHDARVFYDAILRPELAFPWPRNKDKYYLVDSGYPNHPGFMGPYRGERYHRGQFTEIYNFQGNRELFNHRHSSIRNVVERTFGVMKKRFPMLKDGMPPYKAYRQAENGRFYQRTRGDGIALNDDVVPNTASQTETRRWLENRDEISNAMWNEYALNLK